MAVSVVRRPASERGGTGQLSVGCERTVTFHEESAGQGTEVELAERAAMPTMGGGGAGAAVVSV